MKGHVGQGFQGVVKTELRWPVREISRWDDLGEGVSFLGLRNGHWQVPSFPFLSQGVCLPAQSILNPQAAETSALLPISLARHLHGTIFFKCDIISGCSWMHVVRAKWMENPSHSGLCPSLSQAFVAGDQQSSRTLTVSQLCWGEVDSEGWVLGP